MARSKTPVKLTDAQRRELRELYEAGERGVEARSLNPTLLVLERVGYATKRANKDTWWIRDWTWKITPSGVEAHQLRN